MSLVGEILVWREGECFASSQSALGLLRALMAPSWCGGGGDSSKEVAQCRFSIAQFELGPQTRFHQECRCLNMQQLEVYTKQNNSFI